mmetsp:Transcript_29976/g.48433  ORF Transcript_29976/g.48433 Transcript_29976/m.48433 type:complete len:264 (+) Transcript_29976:76-867(+)|eukprot:CAMPEP_0184643380 /NCGR_PEP_ID=MMETSP0308-20130426/212_1 /TAXON_ID=38269 /ORGANISM="Gloeochaete witrockiana, Strain SAG 46.84" /LENGTH=263 /DNA_ID=CAMNT_0027071277 /DNA_START=33 /DNA_END=824 /DNA_ORIENTATION=-
MEDRKEALLKESHLYLESHPELRQILNDFVSACLIHKPKDVVGFARDYFASFLEEGERALVKQTGTEMFAAGVAKMRPIVMCGPSGVGKGTLINRLMNDYPSKFGFSVSHTTRAPRPGEIDGVHYHFSTVPAMEADIALGKFIEHARVHNNLYGTSVAAVADVGKQGKMCVLDIDVQGAQQVKKTNLGVTPLFVFIAPPSTEELEKRLRGRGTETEEKIQTRLHNAQSEMQFAHTPGFFDLVIVNDDLDKAYEELKQFIMPQT